MGFGVYETQQIVRIRNIRVTLIYHFAQLAILGYIIGYGLIYKKAYQATGEVTGSADIKVKGVGWVNQSLPWNGPAKAPCTKHSCFHVYDSFDLIMPPMERDALFVTTNMWVTKNQTRGVCPGYSSDNSCSDTKPCRPMKYALNSNGRQTGLPGSCRTNYTDPAQVWPQAVPRGSYCDVYAWCPTELEITDNKILNGFHFHGVDEFTVFVRMNVHWDKFGVTLDNTAGGQTTTNGLNLWTLGQMVAATGHDFASVDTNGITLGMQAEWNCNFDHSESACTPAISFVRLDDPKSKLSSGFNFRSPEFLHDALHSRQLTKHYGVRLLVLISGVAGKADVAAALIAIGAGIGLLSVARVIADFIATNLLVNKQIYRAAKFSEVKVRDKLFDDNDDDANGLSKSPSHIPRSSSYRPPTERSESWGQPLSYPTLKEI